jgi:hypothetical protein
LFNLCAPAAAAAAADDDDDDCPSTTFSNHLNKHRSIDFTTGNRFPFPARRLHPRSAAVCRPERRRAAAPTDSHVLNNSSYFLFITVFMPIQVSYLSRIQLQRYFTTCQFCNAAINGSCLTLAAVVSPASASQRCEAKDHEYLCNSLNETTVTILSPKKLF